MDTSTHPNVVFAGKVRDYSYQADFLRLTVEKGSAGRGFFAPISELQAQEVDNGHKQVPYKLSDMEGARTGHVCWAKSKTHLLVEFRGAMAEAVYPLYYDVMSKATRLDLALDVWLESHDHSVAEQAFRIATRYMTEKGWNKVRKMPVLVTSANGDTCYLGSRSSAMYFRIYDKWLQSKDDYYENAWRFEVELKSDKAHIVHQQIQERRETSSSGVAEITNGLHKMGVLLQGFAPEGKQCKVPYVATPKDVTSKLLWLSKSVRPTLEELRKRGFESAAYAVLGILPTHQDEG